MKQLHFKFYFLLCCCVFTGSCLHAADEKFNKKKYIKAADEALKAGNVYAAADYYQEVLKNDPATTSVLFNLAQAYFLARDYEKASEYYMQAYRADSLGNQLALYYAGVATKMQGAYKEAIPLFQRFSKIYKEADATKMKKWSRLEIDGCNFALKEGSPDASVNVTHLGMEVNSNYGDVAPALDGDTLFFASVRSDTVIRDDKNQGKTDAAVMKIFTSHVNGETFENAVRFTELPQHGGNICNPAFAADGNKLFYTLCDVAFLNPVCNIYVSEKKEGVWQDGTALNDEINLKGATNTQPFFAKNSQGVEVLYFVSNREGGKGGKDIWYCTLNKRGEYGVPKNAGSKINTDHDEASPFFDAAANTLYFSSDGWISMGGWDIFKNQADASGRFNRTPENLGSPFNSACDDYNFRYGKNNEQGFLVSNRPGIFSVRGKTCCDDIFSYKYDHRIYICLKGRVFDEDTKEPITGAAVNLLLRAEVTGESDVTINTDTSKGNIPYFFNLKGEKLYKIAAVKDGYFTSSQVFDTKNIKKSDTLTVDIYLKKLEKNKAYRLNNIYYDFDKADLRPESKATLDTLYNILIENPTLIIELSSHTDTRGSDQYNMDLSQKRAESCVAYLVNEKGIAKDRITAKGYGESKTLEDCSKYSECPQDQSGDCPCHQLNRRTEFKVIGELDGKLIYEGE